MIGKERKNTLNNSKKLLLYFPGYNNWGLRNTVIELNKYFDLYILINKSINEEAKSFLRDNNISHQLYISNRWIVLFESFLKLFVKELDTSNSRYGLQRSYLKSKSLTERLSFWFRKITPKFLTYTTIGRLLSLLPSGFDRILINLKIEKYIDLAFFTPHYYPQFRAKRMGIETVTIVLSWDNPYKYPYFSNYVNMVLVWNKMMINDLKHIHKLNEKKCVTIGALQFDYLTLYKENIISQNNNYDVIKFIESHKRSYYLYLFCTSDETKFQEIDFVMQLMDRIRKIDKNTYFLLRPYPNVDDRSAYNIFKKYSDVFLDDSAYNNNSIEQNTNLEKIKSIENSKAVINLGTTMALESAYFDIPIIQLAFYPDNLKLSKSRSYRVFDLDIVMKNDHLQKYYFNLNFFGVARSMKDIDSIILSLVNKKYDRFQPLRAHLLSFSKLDGITAINKLIETLEV